jgi:aerobic carbon-monoxide dehydrogenase small subunit
MIIQFELNGKPVELEINPEQTLLSVLRDNLGLIGVKDGCSIGQCGACAVLVNGELRKSCAMLAAQVDGGRVATTEGLVADDGSPNDLQQAFLDHGAVQCGYCIPGMVIAGEALLHQTLTPTRMEIRQAISGNLCRCTGYQQIVDAIEDTASERRSHREAHG